MTTGFTFPTSIDQLTEEQWSKAKCKWFFGKLRKRRLRNKIFWANAEVTVITKEN